jgi:hypothetical protein
MLFWFALFGILLSIPVYIIPKIGGIKGYQELDKSSSIVSYAPS